MSKSHFASFLMDRESQGTPVSEAELKNVAHRLAMALVKRGFDAGEVFGSSTDLQGFAVATEACEILVDISPPEITFDRRWGLQVLLDDPGWFATTREERLGAMKRVEQAVHEALSNDLRAREIGWFLGEGRVSRQVSQPTP
jgi:hypothetical protein